MSQDVDAEMASNAPGSITYSQSDRLRRRLSLSSAGGASDLASLEGYKSQASADPNDDDARSQFSANSFTTF